MRTSNFFGDGAVTGSVIGRVDAEMWAPVLDRNGELLREKLEGFVIDRENSDRNGRLTIAMIRTGRRNFSNWRWTAAASRYYR